MSAQRVDGERVFGGYGGRMVFLMSLGYVVMNVGRYVLPPLLPEIQADLSISRTEAGIVLTVMIATFGFSQYPGGRLSDDWSRSTLIVPAMLIATVGLVLLAGATSLPLILLAGVVFGLGMGLYSTPARAYLSDLFGDRRGRALGVFTGGHDLGGGIASGVAVLILAIGTWRSAFVPLAVVLLGLAVAFVAWQREEFVVNRPSLGLIETSRRLIATPEQRWAMVAFSLFYFMINGILYFLPAFLRETKGFSIELAGGGFALLFLIGIVVKPGVGAISDRVSRHLVAALSLLVSAFALGLLLVSGSVFGIFVAIVLFSIGYKGIYPVTDAILIEAAPDANMGGDLGAAKSWFQGMGSFSPAIAGFLSEAYDFKVAFGVLTACLLLAAVILGWQYRRLE